MSIYTDEFLSELISCSKKIIDPPKREWKNIGRYRRNEMRLESSDKQHHFHVFMRQSEEFLENFSIGMNYFPKTEPSFCLIRYNGRHGAVKEHPHHADFHVHRILSEDLNNDIRAEKHVEITTEYASYEEALRYFLKEINLIGEDKEKYFSWVSQMKLSF